MQIQVTCFGAMREYLPGDSDGRSARLEIAEEAASVEDAVTLLGAPPQMVHAILVNDEPSDLTRRLQDGDQLTLMPHYSGGGGSDG